VSDAGCRWRSVTDGVKPTSASVTDGVKRCLCPSETKGDELCQRSSRQ
jgi:hypothetical protein